MNASDSELAAKATKYLANSSWSADQISNKAKGAMIWINGEPYLDFACGPGVANVGHNHPEVLEAVIRVCSGDEAGWGGNMLLNRYQIELAEKLCQLTPGKFEKKVFFSNSGGEAVEAAVQACMRRRPERPGVLSFIGGFHGRLGYGRTATTSKPLHVEGLPWGIQKAFFLIFPGENPETPAKQEFMSYFSTVHAYMNYVENTIGPFLNEINFALFELVQGEGGINTARPEFVRELFRYLRDHGIRIIVDEVQTGLGRTGRMWASEIYEVEADILTVAKALSGGVVPIGATIFREDLDYRKTGEHCNTFGANPLACAVGLKVLEILERESLAQKAHEDGLWLRGRLTAARAGSAAAIERIHDISGLGQMSRMTFADATAKSRVVAEAMKLGLYLTAAGERSVRLMPPLTISREELEKAAVLLMLAVENAQ